jgi:hypothetical protein
MTRCRVRQPFTLVAAASLLLAAVTGCGGKSGTADAVSKEVAGTETAHVDNCSLVTDAEATALAGKELKHDEDSPLGCGYVRPDRGPMSVFTVRVLVGKGAAKDNFGDHSADTTVHEIPGVGDSAAVLARDEHVNFLIVQKGHRYIQFVTTFLDDMNLGSRQLKQAEDLALTAIGRIK